MDLFDVLPDEILEHVASFLKDCGSLASFAPISRRFWAVASSSSFWRLSKANEVRFEGIKLGIGQKYLQAMYLEARNTDIQTTGEDLILAYKLGRYYQCGTDFEVEERKTAKTLLMSPTVPCILLQDGRISATMTAAHSSCAHAYEVVDSHTANPGFESDLELIHKESAEYQVKAALCRLKCLSALTGAYGIINMLGYARLLLV